MGMVDRHSDRSATVKDNISYHIEPLYTSLMLIIEDRLTILIQIDMTAAQEIHRRSATQGIDNPVIDGMIAIGIIDLDTPLMVLDRLNIGIVAHTQLLLLVILCDHLSVDIIGSGKGVFAIRECHLIVLTQMAGILQCRISSSDDQYLLMPSTVMGIMVDKGPDRSRDFI